jgi:hypothetical protein
MKVYYQNALKTASLSITNLLSGDAPADLPQQDLARTVHCSAVSTTVTASWSVQTTRIADALFISNTNALQGTLRLYNQNQALTRTVNLQLGKWNNKIEFPAQAVGKMELSLQASGQNVYIGTAFLDLGVVLPRFIVGPEMSDKLRGTGGKSRGGQTVGVEGAALETFSASWKRVSEDERRIMRRYIDEVQFHINHYICPYDGIDMYVTITDAGKWVKHGGAGFYWDTEIKYEEAE